MTTTGEVVSPPEDSTIWRQVHPATPLINAWKALGVLVAIIAFNAMEQIGTTLELLGSFPVLWVLAVVVGALLVVLAIALAYSWLAWKRMRYAVGEDAVFHHQGILFRSQRHARLNRIQGVDIIRPLLGRLVGLSVVNIETAGGAKSNVRIQFLRDDEAERLRAEVLARAAGLRGTSRPGAAPGEAPVFSQAPERQVYALGTGDLILSLVLSPFAVGLVAAVLFLVPMAFLADAGWAVLGVIPAVLAFGGMFFSVFDSSFNFTLAVSPDGLRLRHGLLSTRAQTLPPGRVQAVRLTQYLLWRSKDWWRVDVNVAGYGIESNESGLGNRTMLMPVGTRADAAGALWLVLRDLGVDDPDTVVDAALTGNLDDGGFLSSPPSARWVDPIAWRRNGLLITRTALLMRHGRITRTLTVVPHERTQSLAIQQGPWERRLGLADFRADSVPGPIRPLVPHLPARTAGQVLFQQAARARSARSKEGPEEWMHRVGVAEPPEPELDVPEAPGAPEPRP
ncbi:MAG: PH domain-containing protein [Actinomycetota bacterium]